MLKSQTLTIKLSEKRTALNEAVEKREKLEPGAEVPKELLTEIDTLSREMREIDTELRAAITDEAAADERRETAHPDDLTSEERELRTLEKRAKLSDYLVSAVNSDKIDGAPLELNQAMELGANQVPLRMFAPDVEERAMTDVNTSEQQRGWLDRLFADTAAERLGLTMASVPAGIPSYPATLTGGSGAQRAKGEGAAESPWTIGVTNFEPTRMSLHYKFVIEDTARIPGLESALKRDMRAGMRENLDRTIFNGDSGAGSDDADITGFFAQTDIGEITLKQADKVKPTNVLQAFLGLVDGIHAGEMGDIRAVASVPANTLWRGTIANAAAENQTVAAFLGANGLTWGTRAGIAANTNANAFMAAIGLGRGISGAAVVPVWQGATLIRDMYTDAAEGQVRLIMHVLWNWGIVRAANFKRLKAVA